jgi:hypothetical protein
MKNLLFTTMLAFGMCHISTAYAMNPAEEEVISELKSINAKISQETKRASVVKIIEDKNGEGLYKSLSHQAQERVNDDHNGDLSYIVAIMTSIFYNSKNLDDAVKEAGFESSDDDEESDEVSAIPGH